MMAATAISGTTAPQKMAAPSSVKTFEAALARQPDNDDIPDEPRSPESSMSHVSRKMDFALFK
jgi:hypothetical protein